MNTQLHNIIDEIDSKFECIQLNFEDTLWREDIPSEAGWYIIKTNTPISVLKSVGQPQYKAHISIPKVIESNLVLSQSGIAISQTTNMPYIIYNGEAKNLKARAREHENGHPKTYCLGLTNYPILRRYNWTFCYVTVSGVSIKNDDKSLRLAIEQGWRTKHGWPILCGK